MLITRLPEISANLLVKGIMTIAALMGALATIKMVQPFAMASEVERLNHQVSSIESTMRKDVEDLKSSIDQVIYRVELSDVKSEIREIGRVPPEERSAYMRERLVDLERQRRQLEVKFTQL